MRRKLRAKPFTRGDARNIAAAEIGDARNNAAAEITVAIKNGGGCFRMTRAIMQQLRSLWQYRVEHRNKMFRC